MNERLQNEIAASKTKRHEHVWRKFYLVSILIALGSIEITISSGIRPLHLLLYLAPLIAVAFDIYIFGEDYRIRRASAFIRMTAAEKPDPEESGPHWDQFINDTHWEHFKLNYPNVSNEFGCIFVTLVIMAASSIGLWYSASGKQIAFLVAGGLLLEVTVVLFYLSGRRRLSKEGLETDQES
jgi:hypothetical protein